MNRMDKILLYSLLLGLVTFTISSILGYLITGEVGWVTALGTAVGVTIASFYFGSKR
jgi:5-bromo-4-chloroindolyl phosphate hydrolysis protein